MLLFGEKYFLYFGNKVLICNSWMNILLNDLTNLLILDNI